MRKIARVGTIPLRIPFTQLGAPVVFFGRPRTAMEILVVTVETSDGITGYGETINWVWRPVQAFIEDILTPLIVGRDANDVAGLTHELQRVLCVLGRYGLIMTALSGIDIALWDIAGKAAGVPLYRLLGGSGQPVPGYVSIWASARKGATWDWESSDRDVLAERTRIAVEKTGCRYLKVHGTADADLQTIREVAGEGSRLMVDAMCRWTPAEAREAAARLRAHDLYWLEEPIFPPEDFTSLARLQAATGLPLAAGENASTAFEFASMFAAKAVTFAQPAVHRVGGITEFRKVAALAEVHGVQLSPHSHCFGPGLLATMHLMAAQGRPQPMEKSQIPLEASLYGAAVDPVGGFFRPPDGPGLGIEPDRDVLKDYRIAS